MGAEYLRAAAACGRLTDPAAGRVRPGSAPPGAPARQIPAARRASLWYKEKNPITPETERTR